MKTGVLFIHGFTGAPYEVQPFVNYVKDKTDWTVAVPTLPGHGIEIDLGNISADSWLMEAELAIRKLRTEVDRVLVVGFSMGGLIALYLALRYPVDRIVLLSAAAKYISPRYLFEDIRIILAESITKKYPPNTFYHLYNYKLTNTPLRATVEFLKIVKLVEPYYALIEAPVCIVQGEKDGIVPSSSAELLYKKLGSDTKMLIHSPTGKHHICYSEDCQEWFGKVLEFMRENGT